VFAGGSVDGALGRSDSAGAALSTDSDKSLSPSFVILGTRAVFSSSTLNLNFPARCFWCCLGRFLSFGVPARIEPSFLGVEARDPFRREGLVSDFGDFDEAGGDESVDMALKDAARRSDKS
jgi:hypothetical protein